jgi:hypothetical protein
MFLVRISDGTKGERHGDELLPVKPPQIEA